MVQKHFQPGTWADLQAAQIGPMRPVCCTLPLALLQVQAIKPLQLLAAQPQPPQQQL